MNSEVERTDVYTSNLKIKLSGKSVVANFIKTTNTNYFTLYVDELKVLETSDLNGLKQLVDAISSSTNTLFAESNVRVYNNPLVPVSMFAHTKPENNLRSSKDEWAKAAQERRTDKPIPSVGGNVNE